MRGDSSARVRDERRNGQPEDCGLRRGSAAARVMEFEITLRHIRLGRAPPDDGSARRSDLYLTTHNTHKRQKFMPPSGSVLLIKYSSGDQIKKNEMGGARRKYWGGGGVYRIFVRRSDGNKPLGRPRHRCNDNIKMEFLFLFLYREF
jgi:hypothetical protein